MNGLGVLKQLKHSLSGKWTGAWQSALWSLLAMILMGSSAMASDLPSLSAGSQAQSEAACVRDTDDIRRNHMDYLKHKRDLTMHQGIRTPDLSLNECVACHAGKSDSGEFLPVTDEGQFCADCHRSVGEKLDCFMCHRTTPESPMPGNHVSTAQ